MSTPVTDDEGTGAAEQGRASFAARRWNDAVDDFLRADAGAPLAVADLENLATSAAMSARDGELFQVYERLAALYSDAGNLAAAARSSFWAGFRLAAMGETAQSGGWYARAQRLVDEHKQECVATGYLMLPSIRRHMASAQYEVALRVAREASAIGERFADRDLVTFGRQLEGRVLVLQGKIEEGLGLLDEVMVSVIAGGLSPIVTALTYCAVIDACHQACSLDRAREWTSAFGTLCDSQPQSAHFGGICLAHRAEILQLGGEWEKALAEVRRAERRESIPRPIQGEMLYQEAEIHRLRGETKLAEEAYRAASAYGRDPQPGLALLRVVQGRADAAVTAIRRLVDATVVPLERARLLPAFVEISLAANDVAGARSGSDELMRIATSNGGEVLEAMAAHARGAVALAAGDARAAVPCLRRAFDVWHAAGAPYIAARIRVSLSRACRALGDEDGAELELSAARGVFERLGAAHDLERLDSGVATDPVEPPSEHGLTARELQVLRLLATGMTNKAISVELVLSEKTVDRHVSNIFTKTGVGSRAAATAFAYERGLVVRTRG
ncbi:MAG TPA: response regulator transcription factor [Polyangiaceae bacterium]|nr:response regulator transcription factor [Polyangiaceae bacterium]